MLRMPAGMLTQEAGVGGGGYSMGPKAFKGLTLTNLHCSLAIHRCTPQGVSCTWLEFPLWCWPLEGRLLCSPWGLREERRVNDCNFFRRKAFYCVSGSEALRHLSLLTKSRSQCKRTRFGSPALLLSNLCCLEIFQTQLTKASRNDLQPHGNFFFFFLL